MYIQNTSFNTYLRINLHLSLIDRNDMYCASNISTGYFDQLEWSVTQMTGNSE